MGHRESSFSATKARSPTQPLAEGTRTRPPHSGFVPSRLLVSNRHASRSAASEKRCFSTTSIAADFKLTYNRRIIRFSISCGGVLVWSLGLSHVGPEGDADERRSRTPHRAPAAGP